MKRDFTATCFVLEESKILLIFHKKFQKWLPPGGHLDPNELPHEAAIREVKEETGLDVTLSDDTPFPFSYPNAKTIPRPFFMALEDVPAYKDTAAHQHIDFFFLAHPVSGTTTWNENETDAIQWFSEEELLAIPKGEIFEDTREVGLAILRQQCHIMQST